LFQNYACFSSKTHMAVKFTLCNANETSSRRITLCQLLVHNADMNALGRPSITLADKLVHSEQTKHLQQVVILKRTLTVSNAHVNMNNYWVYCTRNSQTWCRLQLLQDPRMGGPRANSPWTHMHWITSRCRVESQHTAGSTVTATISRATRACICLGSLARRQCNNASMCIPL